MKRSKFSEEQIVRILKEADAGGTVKDLCRRHGIATATFYQWKSKYGGLEASDLRKLKELEHENSRLEKMYADLSLENHALTDLIDRKL